MTACAGCSAWLLEVDFGLSDDVRNQQSSSKDLETEPRILLLSQLHRVSLCRSRRTRKSAYTQLVIYVSIEDHSAFLILRLAIPAECDTRKLHGSACSADSPARWLVFRLWFVDNCSRYLVSSWDSAGLCSILKPFVSDQTAPIRYGFKIEHIAAHAGLLSTRSQLIDIYHSQYLENDCELVLLGQTIASIEAPLLCCGSRLAPAPDADGYILPSSRCACSEPFPSLALLRGTSLRLVASGWMPECRTNPDWAKRHRCLEWRSPDPLEQQNIPWCIMGTEDGKVVWIPKKEHWQARYSANDADSSPELQMGLRWWGLRAPGQ